MVSYKHIRAGTVLWYGGWYSGTVRWVRWYGAVGTVARCSGTVVRCGGAEVWHSDTVCTVQWHNRYGAVV